MKKLLLIVVLIFTSNIYSQLPKNGTYTYAIVFKEWNGMRGPNCIVIIKGNKIKIIHNGGNLSGKKVM